MRTQWQQTRLRVGLIGVDPVGRVLGQGLNVAGHRVVAVAPDPTSLTVAETPVQVTQIPLAPPTTLPKVVQGSDLLLLTQRGPALAASVRATAECGLVRAGQFAMHTDLAAGLDILAPLTAEGLVPLLLYPLLTQPPARIELQQITQAPLLVSTVPELRWIAQALAIELGAEPFWVDPEQLAVTEAALRQTQQELRQVVRTSLSRVAATGLVDPVAVLAPVLRETLEQVFSQQDSSGGGDDAADH